MNKLYARLALSMLLSLWLGSALAAGDDAGKCAADLEDLATYLPVNDAGASAELAHHRTAIDAALSKARADAARLTDPAACEGFLNAYLSAWRPGHLWVMSNQAASAIGNVSQEKTDPRAPTLEVLDKDTVLLSLGSFYSQYQGPLEAILKTRRAELVSHKHWIIDVRKNDGGSDSTYASLLPWLVDGEITVHNVEWLATPANARAQEDICEVVGDRASCLQQLAPIIAAVRGGAPGSWVMAGGEPVRYMRFDQAKPPQPERVAVLIDHPCGSSCEQFLLTVRGSFRVKLLGRPTYGTLDVSNVRPHRLPSGQRTLMYATSRSTRLPTMGIDQVGVQPDLLLPVPADAAARAAELRQAQRWLAVGTLRPQ
jgi:hypothetical protein